MLKFVIPPAEASEKLPKYAYYREGVGFRTFFRMADMKNSMNHQGLLARVEVPGQSQDTPPYRRQYEHKVDKTWYVLELVDGEWYIRWKIEPGTSRKDLPWMEEVVRVNYGYSDYFYPITELQRFTDLMNGELNYKPKHVTTIVRRKSDASQREEYVEWRIKVALERYQEKFSSQKIYRGPVFNDSTVTQPTLSELDSVASG